MLKTVMNLVLALVCVYFGGTAVYFSSLYVIEAQRAQARTGSSKYLIFGEYFKPADRELRSSSYGFDDYLYELRKNSEMTNCDAQIAEKFFTEFRPSSKKRENEEK